jgi:mRNA interferase RelE/StbE
VTTGASGSGYQLILDRKAERDLSALPDQDYKRLDPYIVALADNPRPHGTLKLEDDLYRLRVGPWRIVYMIDDAARLVIVSRVVRRQKDTYRRL